MDDEENRQETSPWLAMARELAANPDSPASLRIISGVNAALRPREQAANQIVMAFADQLEQPRSEADAAVAAAVKHWESVCQAQMEETLLAQFRQDAADLFERRRRQPPPIESIVGGVDGRIDVGYDLRIHLQGLRGTWHRLWASISTARLFGDAAEQRDCVDSVRAQFEEALGRQLSGEEWSKLEAHAHLNSDTVLRPMLDQGDQGLSES